MVYKGRLKVCMEGKEGDEEGMKGSGRKGG